MADHIPYVDNLVTAANRVVAAWLNQVNSWTFWGRRPGYAATTGSANAQILTLETGSLYTTEADGDEFPFKAGFTNSGATTLQIIPPAGTNTARALQLNGQALVGGEVQVGMLYKAVRLGTTWQLTKVQQASDGLPLVVNSADITKKLRFSLASITTATTRVITWADQNLTFAALTTKGDSWWASAIGVLARLAVGSNGQLLVADSTASAGVAWKSTIDAVPLPRSYLAGCGLTNNAGDATNDIDIAVGVCRDSSNAFNISVAALTKQLDANWAPGSSAGMRYSGAAIANATYGIWAAAKADGTQDIYAYPNTAAPSVATVLAALQAETNGSAYLYLRRIGCILRESAAIVVFSQEGDEFLRSVSVLDVDANNPGTSAVLRTLSVPVGIKVWALTNWFYSQAWAGAQTSLYISSPDQSDQAVSTAAAPLSSISDNMTSAVGTNTNTANLSNVRTNTSAQVRSRFSLSDGSVTIRCATLGWIDTRGRDA